VTAATTTKTAAAAKLAVIQLNLLVLLVETTGVRSRVGDTVCRVRVTRRRTTGNMTATATLLALELTIDGIDITFSL
jgi:hypothetical protein